MARLSANFVADSQKLGPIHMIKWLDFMFRNVFARRTDSEAVFLLGAEHCPPLPSGVLEHGKELARTRCATNSKLAYVFGQAITQLKPQTIAEAESILAEHEQSLAGHYPIEKVGWSPVDVKKFIETLSVGVELPHKTEEYLYVSTNKSGDWHFLRYYAYVCQSGGKQKDDYCLGWIGLGGLRVEARGDQSSIKEIILFAESEPRHKNSIEASIGRGLRCACEILLHVSALPAELLSSMRDAKECTVNAAGVEITYKTSTGYYRPADMDLTAIIVTLRKNN
ncbi:MAG: hypothetical protein ACRDBL_10560 [Rhabdaerophilum sp.]